MNNNPFQPTNSTPPVMTPGDDGADSFVAPAATQSKPPAKQTAQKTAQHPKPDQPQPVHNNQNPAKEEAEVAAPAESDLPDQANYDPIADPIDTEIARTEMSQPQPNPAANQIENLAMQADAYEPAPPSGVKTHRLSISILTLLFFLLTLAGGAGTFIFHRQNSENVDLLSQANARIQELEANGADISISDDKDSSQYEALQNKIADLTKEKDENTKKIEEQNKKIEDLTAKNKALEEEATALTKKVQNIEDLTNKVNSMTNKLNTVLENCYIGSGNDRCSFSVPRQ